MTRSWWKTTHGLLGFWAPRGKFRMLCFSGILQHAFYGKINEIKLPRSSIASAQVIYTPSGSTNAEHDRCILEVDRRTWDPRRKQPSTKNTVKVLERSHRRRFAGDWRKPWQTIKENLCLCRSWARTTLKKWGFSHPTSSRSFLHKICTNTSSFHSSHWRDDVVGSYKACHAQIPISSGLFLLVLNKTSSAPAKKTSKQGTKMIIIDEE